MNKIFTFAFNRPDLLEKQYLSFEKNVKGDFEFNVAYDHRDNSLDEKFFEVCEKYSLNLYDHFVESSIGPSGNHARCVEWIFNDHLKDDDNVIMLDHDIFLMSEFDIDEYFNLYDIYSPVISKKKFDYICLYVFGFKYKKIKDFNLNFYPGSYDGESYDTFGDSHRLLRDSSLKFKKFDHKYYAEINPDSEHNFEIFDDKFIHLYAASGWHKGFGLDKSDEERMNFLLSII